MNKLCCLIGMFLTCNICNAQILCIYCYDQNDTISAGVNNLVLNGGFENNNCIADTSIFCPNSSNYSCNIANWICTGGGSSTYACLFDTILSTIVEGTNAVYFGNGSCKACSSIPYDTSCLNNIDCSVIGIPAGYPLNVPTFGDTVGLSLQQTITGLSVGQTYVLEFWAGGESYGGLCTKKGIFTVDIGFGDTLLREKPTEPTTGIGTRFIIEFNATSPSHTIKFTNWGHICTFCTELIIDDVRLYTLAELSPSVPHCTVGIDNLSSQNIENVFPNPLTNTLNVKIGDNEPSEIILYDIASRKIQQQKFTNTVSVNTEQLAKGIYVYEVRDKNGLCKKGKVVKD